jgi:uncharacterized RDD family membrane protein YckC
MELRSHIADRVERGQSVEEAIRRLGDPDALAVSYLSAVPLVPAPHVRRAAAKFVDLIIPIAFCCGMAALYVFVIDPEVKYEPLAILAAGFVVGTLALYSIYLMIAEYAAGRTLGKRLFGLRVVTESGTRIGLGQAFVRQLPSFFQFFWIDGMFTLFTDRRQRAFEMLSKTRVVVADEARRGERVPAASPTPVAL